MIENQKSQDVRTKSNQGNRFLVNNILSNYSVWIILFFLIIIGTILSNKFFSGSNFLSILSQIAVLGLLALAESITLITGHFDVSIEQNMIFCAVIGAWLCASAPNTSGWNLNTAITILLMIIVGSAIGFFNGLMVGYFGMNAFMGTLSTSLILSGLNIFLYKGFRFFGFPKSFLFIGSERLFGILPIPLILLILIFVVFHLILTKTNFGRELFAVGSNRSAARAVGIKDKRIICIAYTVTGGICGIAGLIIAGRMNAAFADMTKNYLFIAFAAAVIGGVSLKGGKGLVFGIFGGALVMVLTTNIMNISIRNEYLVQLAVGLIILVAVILDTARQRLTSN